jgi:EAL domain-containing protein (putative c-di-GMP-specific phosphodiesterase class I)
LSGQSVGDRTFHRWAFETLEQAGAAVCGRLCLEITETAAITKLADAAAFIEQVRALGVRVALDDFGAGASSFGYLKDLDVDFIKIDGRFVRGILTDAVDAAAVRCFIEVAKTVEIETVAEFVESETARDRLTEMGVDFVQGYLIHRPAPIDDLLPADCLRPSA